MKICFFTDEFHPDESANSLLIQNVCLSLINLGVECFVIPFLYEEKEKKYEHFRGINIHRFVKHDTFNNALKEGKISSILEFAIKKIFKNRTLWKYERVISRGEIDRFLIDKKIDAVMSINCSIELSFPLLRLRQRNRLNAKWAIYFIDPLISHPYYLSHYSIKHLRRIQRLLLDNCDLVICNKMISSEIIDYLKGRASSKMCVCEFPKIIKPIYEVSADDVILDPKYINIVYTGSRNEKERSSKYYFDLISRLKLDKLRFIIVGEGWDNVCDNRDNVICINRLSHQAVLNIQLQADYLLNIGNESAIQIPSKIFEYLATGKPIINICKNSNCPTIEILRGYDALNIYENQDINLSVRAFEHFLLGEHQNIYFDNLKNKYIIYTPDYFCKRIIEHLERNKNEES